MNSTQWSKIVTLRRMTWYGNLFRLPEDTPARKSSKETPEKSHGVGKINIDQTTRKRYGKVGFKTLVKTREGSFNSVQVKEHKRFL